MTTTFRIDSVRLDTTEGVVQYDFPSALTVLAGPVGVGKTTLFELIRYGLGGKSELAKVAVDYVRDVAVTVRVRESRLRLVRSLDSKKRSTVRVFDLISDDRLPDRYVNRDPSISSLLLDALGFPTEMRAAARSQTTTNVGNRISFADLFSYMYVRQGDINRDIASSQESVREPKRKAVFELFFGITDEEVLGARSEIARLNGELSKSEQDYDAVVQFLRDSSTASRLDAERELAEASNAQASAEAELYRLRDTVDPIEDRETRVLRDLLNEAERNAAEARYLATMLAQQQVDYSKERKRLAQERERLDRMQDAGQRLAAFEFHSCPRCMQDVHQRDVKLGVCRLCLQSEPIGEDPDSSYGSYEQRQLTDQLEEIDGQLALSAEQFVDAQQAIDDRQLLVSQLSAEISSRTRDRVTPQLQAFSDATRQLADAKARQQFVDAIIRQWDRADALGLIADDLRRRIDSQRSALDRANRALEQQKMRLFDELDEEFNATVSAIGIPGVEEAGIDRRNYLPMLNGQSFRNFSPSGGGIRTATQVAYWLTLMTVALRRRDTQYPAFLLIDGPRTSLNDDQLSEALYRRIVTQVDAADGRLQIILGDRELPVMYRRSYRQIEFSYENPTVSTVAHPGPAAVNPIFAEGSEGAR